MNFVLGRAELYQLRLHVARNDYDRCCDLKQFRVAAPKGFQRPLPVSVKPVKVSNQRDIHLVARVHHESRGRTEFSQYCVNSILLQETRQSALLKKLRVEFQ